jgi:hypothetical protein
MRHIERNQLGGPTMKRFSLLAALAIFPLTGCIADTQQLDEEPIAQASSALTEEDGLVLSSAGTARLPCDGCLGGYVEVRKADAFGVWDGGASIELAEHGPYDIAGDTPIGFAKGENVNALHWGTDYVVASTAGNATIRGMNVKGGDLVKLATDSHDAEVVFTGSHHFKKSTTKIDAVYQWDAACTDETLPGDCRWALSTTATARVGADEFKVRAGDVFLYNADTHEVEVLLVDIKNGPLVSGRCKTEKSEQIDGFHVMADGTYLISTGGTTHMGPCDDLERYTDGDVIQFNPMVPNDPGTRYFAEATYQKNSGASGANEETDAVTVRP